MPQSEYEVTFPDGHVQKFTGPSGMSQQDQQMRAIQERSFGEGRIPTTWFGGASKALGEDKATTQALISGVGYATGQPEIVAAAPAAARGIQYLTQRATGQNPSAPSASQIGGDIVVGAAQAYGGKVVDALKAGAASTVAHQSPLTGQWVRGIAGHGVMPWAVRTAGEAANAVANSPIGRFVQATQPRYLATGVGGGAALGISAAAPLLAQMKELMSSGKSAYSAAMEVSQGDSAKAQALLGAWARTR
jgi:hypothetical protein